MRYSNIILKKAWFLVCCFIL